MHILLITDSYPPEIRSAAHLMLELAEELRDRGHKVAVATTWPRYNLDEEMSSKEFPEICEENGIRVLRIKTLPHHGVAYWFRGLAELLMPLQFWRKLRQHQMTQVDAVVVYAPPLPLALLGVKLKKQGVRFILNVQDIFPKNAIDLGILVNPVLIRFFQWMERSVYCNADVVTLHSEGNHALVSRNLPEELPKFQILHNWVDIDHHINGKNRVDFREKYGIGEKRVALFAGVLGPAQYLELLLRVAEELQDENELIFLIVGDGTEKKKLMKFARQRKLRNVMFQPFVSREHYPDLLGASDIGIVCLSPLNKTPVVPGKLQGYMAAGLPVVTFLNRESDGHQIVKHAEAGLSAPSDDQKACTSALRDLLKQKDLTSLGLRGQAYARQHFSKASCVSQLESLLVSSGP